MAGLYLHIPFCSVKCHFCDFTAFSGQSRTVDRYQAALIKEGALRRKEWENEIVPGTLSADKRVPGTSPTLYIGGGTPSELNPQQLSAFLTWVTEAWGTFPESTFEANPESLSNEKIKILKDWGMTRVSIGLQAAQDRLLKGLGRQHSFEEFLGVYEKARGMIRDVNVDLMFGLPGQSMNDWKETLNSVNDLQPDHISLYGLRVEERTVFAKKGVEADEDLGADMYKLAVDMLKSEGFHHYEISNFAKPGKESLHNLGYWKDQPYLGLGCGATSFTGGERKSNAPTLEGYCAAIEAGRTAIVSSERLAGKERLGESIMIGLRQVDGMDLSLEMSREFDASFRRLQEGGLVELSGGKARLTPRGLLVANQVLQEFVAPF